MSLGAMLAQIEGVASSRGASPEGDAGKIVALGASGTIAPEFIPDTSNDAAVDALSVRVDGVADGVLDLGGAVQAVSATVDALGARLDDLSNDRTLDGLATVEYVDSVRRVVGTDTQLAAAATAIDESPNPSEKTVLGRTGTLETSMSAVAGRVSSLESSVNTLSATAASIGGIAAGASAAVSTLSSGLSAVESRLGAAESDLSNDAESVAGLLARMDAVDGVSGSIAALEARVTAIEGAVSGMSAQVSEWMASITATVSDIYDRIVVCPGSNDDPVVHESSLSNYYTRTEVDSAVDAASGIRVRLYDGWNSMPSAGAGTMGAIYLVPSSSQTQGVRYANLYDEFITVNYGEGQYEWELVGVSRADLLPFATSASMDSLSAELHAADAALGSNDSAIESRLSSVEDTAQEAVRGVGALEEAIYAVGSRVEDLSNDVSLHKASSASSFAGLVSRVAACESNDNATSNDIDAIYDALSLAEDARGDLSNEIGLTNAKVADLSNELGAYIESNDARVADIEGRLSIE